LRRARHSPPRPIVTRPRTTTADLTLDAKRSARVDRPREVIAAPRLRSDQPIHTDVLEAVPHAPHDLPHVLLVRVARLKGQLAGELSSRNAPFRLQRDVLLLDRARAQGAQELELERGQRDLGPQARCALPVEQRAADRVAAPAHETQVETAPMQREA